MRRGWWRVEGRVTAATIDTGSAFDGGHRLAASSLVRLLVDTVTPRLGFGEATRFLPTIAMHDYFMREALRQAQAAMAADEVPVGAIIAHEGRIVAAAHNQREALRDPTAHAEMIAITQAAEAIGSWRLEGCVLYATLEPCPMCAGAILQARVPTVVYGASDAKAGAVASLYQLLSDARLNHRCEIVPGVLAEPCGAILTEFFRRQRALGKK